MLINMEEVRKSIGTAEGLGEKFSGADFISSANALLMLAQEALDMNNLGRFRLQPAVRGDHGALLLKITEKGHPESDYIDYRKYKKNISYLFEYLYWKLSGKPNDQKTLVKVKSDLDRLVSERYERNLQKRLREEKEKERIQKQKYLSRDQLRDQVENSSNGTIYLVGIRRTKVVRLVAYRGRDLEDNRKTGVGLSYQDILGGYDYEPVYQSPSKEECIKYKISIADVDNIVNNKVNVIQLPLENLKDFEDQMGITIIRQSNLDKYGNTNRPEYQPMQILSKIENIGCQCVDVHGNIINLRNADVLKYANSYGFANAKVYEKLRSNGSTIVISGINETFPIISVSEAQNIQKRTVSKVQVNKQLKSYVAKTRMIGAGDFEIDETTSTLLKCNGNEHKTLKIPPVKIIGYEAVRNIKAKEVIIPQTVEVIGRSAFCGSDIETLRFEGEKILKVGDDAFQYLTLRHLDLGKLHDFGNGNDFKNGFLALVNNRQLEDITVSEENSNYTSIDGVLYNKDVTRLIRYPIGRKNSIYIMPNTIEETNPFIGISGLKKLVLSDELERLYKGLINN